MATNDFVPFCPTDTGTNLLSQAAYLADAQLAIGSQPGVARSKLVNKALRQATYIASSLAQYISNVTGDNVLDDATQSEVLTTLAKALKLAPTVQVFTSGSGTYTRPSGPSPLYIRVRAVGGGAGGGGGTTSGAGTDGVDGGNTTFGTTLIVANGGSKGIKGSNAVGAGFGGIGGSASTGAATGLSVRGGTGTNGSGGVNAGGATSGTGGSGGSSALGGNGGGGSSNQAGTSGATNSGAGGGGGGAGSGSGYPGGGGGAGGFVDAIIFSPSASYAYSVGAGGAGGAGDGGTSGASGGAGGSGYLIVEEYYQ